MKGREFYMISSNGLLTTPMTMLSSATYHCVACNQVRLLAVDKEEHQKRVENSPNGLSTYSDIC